MSLLDKFINEIPKVPLHHYTNHSGLMGIINNNSIWLTHYRYLNDTDEYKYGVGLALKELSKRELDRNGDQFNNLNSYFERSYMSSHRDVFVASFSSSKDSLSQWRAYGQQSGYSIGFEGRALMKLAHKHGVYLCKCSYDPNEHRQLINEVLDRKEELRSKDLSFNKAEAEIEELLLKVFCVIKNPAFKDEEEWRLIYSPKSYFFNADTVLSDRDVLYRSTVSFIVPYINLELARNDFCNALHEIYVGPNKYMEEALISTKRYIESAMKPDRHLLPGVLSTTSTYRGC
jgi:hypothetical protein